MAPLSNPIRLAFISCLVLVGACLASAAEAATIRVPADFPTIQQAIDAAVDGDIVLVSPGTYFERITFRGKDITVASEQGPDVTTIDGLGGGTVVTFTPRVGKAAVLSGFTIRGGSHTHNGGGIQISSASPFIRDNTITENSGCSGTGISAAFSAARIERNKIVRNAVTLCTGAWGIGIFVLGTAGTAAPEIVDNEISDNRSIGATFGGGVGLNGAGAVVLRGNVISRNMTVGPQGCGWGGGVNSANQTQATLADNLIVGNDACFGGGMHWGGNNGTNIWVNNTIADNTALQHPGVVVSGFSRNELYNNIIAAAAGPALFCEFTQPLFLSANDIFSEGTAAYGGICADQTGVNGNISAAPSFVDPARRDYRLTMTSPAIDSGYDGAPLLPATDLEGHARVVDGDGDGMAHVDMGAFEYHNHAPTVSASDDQTVTIGNDCLAQVTLSATGSDDDGDAMTFTWTSSLGMTTGATVSLTLPAGTHVVTVTASDGNGGFASDTVVVSVLDPAPPVIESVTATPAVISRADHKMTPVVLNVSVSDACAGVSCRIVSVTSNEPVDGTGDGDTGPDWEITGDLTVNLRAERAGTGTGRVYTIAVACTDPSGNQSTSTMTVTVPR